MANTRALENTISLLLSLYSQAEETQKKIIDENSDPYFYQNANFFSKSFIVLLCAYLEAYLKQTCQELVEKVNSHLKSLLIPHNLARWSIQKESFKKDRDYKYQSFEIDISKEDLDDLITANVGVTIDIYRRFGIDLDSCASFKECKDKIGSIVSKRNNIIHHSDDASDLSLLDLMENIKFIERYIAIIDREISTRFFE